MEILSIIPARGGSKGIKRKNLKPILNKPLIAYSIESSLNSKYITKTIVSSEDSEILEVAKQYGAEIVVRPEFLAADETKTAPVMLHVADSLDDYKPDYVVLLQPTCPLRDENYIDKGFKLLFENLEKGYDSCFGVYDMGYTHSKWRILHDNRMEALYDYRIRPRRQEEEQHYRMLCENGAFYALKYDVFREVKDFIGKNPIPYITPRIIDIDTEEDFKKVEEILLAKQGY